ncbi:MAG: hypothetical protein H6733_15650 [Alphaproteobacteria bacterium]|nr:hypothetical protein [Alphaproteobacteria bacterium]
MTRTPVLAVALAAACTGGVRLDVEADPAERLSTTGLVAWDGTALSYAEGVQPYTLNTPLFSDYALKDRAIYVPPGEVATVDDGGRLQLPVGSAILKTFSFAPDLRSPDDGKAPVETRLLVRREAGWKAWPYVWDDDGRDATLQLGGDVRDITLIDPTGEAVTAAYLIPQKNQCADCHELKDDSGRRYMTPIGPTLRNLDLPDADGTNQLDRLVSTGILTDVPPLDTVTPAWSMTGFTAADAATLPPAELDAAARTYLDVNCAHCHNPHGVNGISSQLFLDVANDDVFHLGACKRPGSAGKGGIGREFDIVPGDHEASILYYRMITDDLGAMMPDVGRSLLHHEGAALIAAWIDAMPPDDCRGP